MTLEEVKQFLKDNADDSEVQSYIEELSAPTTEQMEGFLDTAEGKKLIQPRLDQNFTKGLNTWKEKNLDTMLKEAKEEGRKEANPQETPEQKELRELREQFDSERKERTREQLRNKAFSVADEKGLPKDQRILDRFLGDDEDSTLENLGVLEEVYQKDVQSKVDARFKENGGAFQSSQGGIKQTGSPDISALAGEANITNK